MGGGPVPPRHAVAVEGQGARRQPAGQPLLGPDRALGDRVALGHQDGGAAAAKACLTTMGKELINSPEMVAMVEPMVAAIINPSEHNTPCVEKLMDVTFMNPIDRPCLSIMIPVLK